MRETDPTPDEHESHSIDYTSIPEDDLEDPYADEEAAGTAVCTDCGDETELFSTIHGLRCSDCREHEPVMDETYTPSMRPDVTPSEPPVEAQRLDEFYDELPEIEFAVTLPDGSEFVFDEMKSYAILLKHGDNWRGFLESFTDSVERYFKMEHEPSKYGDVRWGGSSHEESKDEYETQADLAPVVGYYTLRGALMQISLTAMSGPEEDPVSVIEIGDDTVTKYSEQGRVTLDMDADLGGEDE